MSIYSGKYDLADHIAGQGGWFNKEGKPVEFGDKDTYVFCSDEYRDFLAFKKKTGGVIHQHIKVEVTPWNLDFIKEHCKDFDYIKNVEKVPDNRTKEGYREKTTFTYYYWKQEHNDLKKLNKQGVYITLDIHFNTILDLIPYYPYLVGVCYTDNDGRQVVYISNQSFVIKERNEMLRGGFEDLWEYYNKKLQDHYREVVLRYFNPEGREHIEELTFDENRQSKVSKPIDENFDVEWDTNKPHWTSPKVIDYDKGIIEMSEEDYNYYLGKTMKVKYVEKKEHEVHLW